MSALLLALLLTLRLLISPYEDPQVSECLLGHLYSLMPTLSPPCPAASRRLAFRIPWE